MNLHQFLTSICFVLAYLTLVSRFGLDSLGAFLISLLSIFYVEIQRALKKEG